jgi:hypothetical protein
MPDADTIQDCDQSDIWKPSSASILAFSSCRKIASFPVNSPWPHRWGFPGGSYWLTVTIGDGSFPLEEQFPEQLREDTTFTVTGFTRVQLDEKGRDHKLLKDDQRGLLRIKRRMLSIVGQQLTLDDGTPIGADRVYAVRASKPEAVSNATTNLGTISVTFGLAYDWDLPEAPGDD